MAEAGERAGLDVPAALRYAAWSERSARELGYSNESRVLEGSLVSMTRCQKLESHSDPATEDLSIQVCTAGEQYLTGDFGFGRFSGWRRPGVVVVGPAHQSLELAGGSRTRFEILAVCLNWSEARRALHGVVDGDVPDLGSVHAGPFHDPMIEHVALRLWDALAEGSAVTRLFADSATLMIMTALLRRRGPAPVSRTHRLTPGQVGRVVDYLKSRLGEEIRLEDLAAQVHLSTFHFARAFQATLGVPPHRYLVGLRLERAKELLRTTRRPIIDIALDVGYGSPQALARVFKQSVGETPTDYRRMAV